MVAEDDGIGAAEVGPNGGGEVPGTRSFVWSGGDEAEEDFDFGKDSGGDGFACDGEGCSMRWVAMDDGAGAGFVAIDFEVEANLTGAWSRTGELVGVEIDRTEIGGSHVALANERGSAEDDIVGKAAGDIAVVSGGHGAGIDAASDVADLSAEGGFVGSGDRVRHARILGGDEGDVESTASRGR